MRKIVKHIGGEKGVSLMETIVVIGLVGTLFGATLASFFSTSRHSYDHDIITQAQEQAKIVLDMMAFDIRMSGAGVPLGQTFFTVTDATLGDAPLPILTTSTASTLSLRLNEKGSHTVLTADFDPAVVNWFNVYDASGFEDGDEVYINNMTAGGGDGLFGTISGIAGDIITIDAAFTTNAGSDFGMGSLVERVTTVTYDSPVDWSGITRDAGTGTVVLVPNSTFTVEYVDDTGTAIVLPLLAATVEDTLAGITLTVNVRGRQALKNGTVYTAEATQSLAFRNLNVSR